MSKKEYKKDALIVDQALMIKKLKDENKEYQKSMRNINGMLVGIGGPLNDNKYGYNKEQLKIFFDIENQIIVKEK